MLEERALCSRIWFADGTDKPQSTHSITCFVHQSQHSRAVFLLFSRTFPRGTHFLLSLAPGVMRQWAFKAEGLDTTPCVHWTGRLKRHTAFPYLRFGPHNSTGE